MTLDMLDNARSKLAKNKATGNDELSDEFLHNENIWPYIREKVCLEFYKWLVKGKVPKYLKEARVIPLSKA